MTPVGSLSTARLKAMISVSRSVAEADDLASTLNLIAEEAARTVGALGAIIHLISRDRLRLGGSWGVSNEYRSAIVRRMASPAWAGPMGRAFERSGQLVIPNIQEDPVLGVNWAQPATAEGYRSMAVTPLILDGDFVGALNVYRGEAGPWPQADLELLSFLADHAASALRVANLFERQARQLEGIQQVLRGLREQTHEHANRVHAVSALVALGEQAEARAFIAELLREHEASNEAVIRGIKPAGLAGLLLAEIVIARQRSIRLKVDRRSRLDRLPRRLTEVESIALVGHLLGYAYEGLGDVPVSRRRVTFRAWNEGEDVVLSIRDWARSAAFETPSQLIDGVMFDPSKSDRRLNSVARSLLLEAAESAGAQVTFEPQGTGVRTTVRIPV
jgi:GAF domain-containing protein